MTDILQAVNDSRISWTQRIKLARYAWASENVLVPNKRRILLSTLVNAVTASNRSALYSL